MAVKSIISIDVQDGAFTAFQRTFQQYQQQLGNNAKAWGIINKSISGGKQGFRELVDEMKAAEGRSKLIAIASARAAQETKTTADKWNEMATSSKVMLSNVLGITSSILRWASVGGVISTLAGIGGVFGIDRFASSISAGRRQSLGTGSSFGETRAFQTNFSRIADPDSLLSGVNTALHGDRSGLFGAGLNNSQLGGSTAQVGVALLRSLKKLADSTDDRNLGFVHKARGLGQFLSTEDFQRLKATSGAELEGLVGGFGRDKNSLGAGPDTLQLWQNFSTQLGRAGSEIETVFIKGLTPLIGPLTDLSGAVSTTIKSFLEAPQLKVWMKDIGEGLGTFAKYVGTPDFQKSVEQFVDGLGVIGSKIASIIKWFGGSPTGGAGPAGLVPSGAGSVPSNNPTLAALGFGGPGGLAPTVKAGAGFLDPGLASIAKRLQDSIPGIGPVTAGADDFHRGIKSAHNDGRAFDLRLNDPSRSAEIAQKVREELQRQGIAGTVIDEYKNPSKNSTGGHLHVQTANKVDVMITDATGGNVNVTANQAAR